MDDEEIRTLQKQIAQIGGALSALVGERPEVLFADYAYQYLQIKLKSPVLREATKRSFEQQIRLNLVPAFGKIPLRKITNEDWLSWVVSVRNGNASSKISVFFNARKALAEVLNAAKKSGLIDTVPVFDSPDESRDVGRALEESEIIRLLWKSRRPFRFIFFCFFRMGCRPREILQWEWSMISWNEPGKTTIEIPARISKTKRARKIPLNPCVSRILYRRHTRGNGSRFVFPDRCDPSLFQKTYSSAWATALAKAGISKAVPYDMRRTFVTRCALEGLPPLLVSKLLDTSVKLLESTYSKINAGDLEGLVK